ncbi:MAG: hypothetical protein K0R37_2743, partial [Arthrobacter sp.]|nr:hypothetical protein [Arthrobacter sp.]
MPNGHLNVIAGTEGTGSYGAEPG